MAHNTDLKVNADTIITSSAVLMLSPDEAEIADIKTKQGEDNFYTIADDANYYSAEIDDASPNKINFIHHKTIDFPKENYVFDKKEFQNKWLVIDYKVGSQPKIYSLVDYYLHLTGK
ncbi:hypothetical protein EG347_06795 [Chryseobacterium sp. G0186]|uniref:hypothetical protein n=1 Tax=Chryseobacterium sp. G0186 TaxID=2487064 RepID=UPI000F50DAD8|nr:hypothetical protein [Chryseobacterium sp. G0186]AZA77231.1 hypothetical protein EG347_06795 [Chryseobacterium sp. G0186]